MHKVANMKPQKIFLFLSLDRLVLTTVITQWAVHDPIAFHNFEGAWNHPLNNYGFIAFQVPLNWKARDREHKMLLFGLKLPTQQLAMASFATPLKVQSNSYTTTNRETWQKKYNGVYSLLRHTKQKVATKSTPFKSRLADSWEIIRHSEGLMRS